MTANAEVWETYAILHEVTENSEKVNNNLNSIKLTKKTY